MAGTRTMLAPPRIRPWRDVPPFEPSTFGPAFARHIEFRADRPVAVRGGTEPRVEGWLRWKRPGVRRDAAFLAACIDSYWPSAFSIEPAPRPMATIAFTFQPVYRRSGIADDAVYYRGTLAAQEAGYCVELRELWSEDGRLLALNQQSLAIIK